MVDYRTTESECRSKIEGVCSRCGGEIEPIETVDNSRNPTFWSGCVKCGFFDSGVDPKVFKIAKQLVEDGYRYYRNFDPKDNEETLAYKLQQEVSAACSTVRRVLWLDKNS
jgi:hypothetical protein